VFKFNGGRAGLVRGLGGDLCCGGGEGGALSLLLSFAFEYIVSDELSRHLSLAQ